MSEKTLQGKMALVTGASRGIGQAIALRIGELGAVVVGTSTSEQGAAGISDRLEQAGIGIQDGKTASGRPLYNSDTTVVAGDPSAVRDQYEELRELGFDLIVTFFEDFQDLSAMKLFIDEVIPEFS